ncbi:aminopeptidase P . Metallo peptidase. MEROPS family M24B [Formivibrio citricus]|uniref:Xaa-Pro aminopeptidase n=1 Tax=Formivibrio citricus TaxID=83765 RepID=A0A1I5CCU9_9NEIS|nr:Xaa-Pro aminopeptidase [Formivibrio citricus]SFN84704.1 aminopeptidase P . Metallo peptidase. MEROPS family M24B [Formivibrio citricus]
MSHPPSFAERRQRLASRLRPGVVILPTNPEMARNADSSYPYRFDSSFFYLTGFREPEAVFVQVIGEGKVENLLFCREKNEEREIWDGYRYGPAAAAEKFGFDAAFPIDELDAKLAELLQNQPRIYFPFGKDAGWDRRLAGWLDAVRAQVRNGIRAPNEIVDIRNTLHEMRLYKDAHEIALLRHAGRINATAHIRAMRAARPGLVEYEIEAEFLHEFCRHGSRFPAYGSIVASGANACVLHYVENDRRMQDGDLLLIDAGCELDGYASDITRTFPVNGRFSSPQRDVYEITLAAHQAAFDLAKPGTAWHEIHDAATKVLAQGMLDLGLLQGTLDAVLESGSYKQFYMHRTGHWLGLDVHDVGEYKVGDDWRKLEPGMVFTIEPGFYIRPAANVPKHLENIGIRIEDDVLVTTDGHENLTALCPRSVADIETVMAAK